MTNEIDPSSSSLQPLADAVMDSLPITFAACGEGENGVVKAPPQGKTTTRHFNGWTVIGHHDSAYSAEDCLTALRCMGALYRSIHQDTSPTYSLGDTNNNEGNAA